MQHALMVYFNGEKHAGFLLASVAVGIVMRRRSCSERGWIFVRSP